MSEVPLYRGTSLIRNSPPPHGRHRALGMVLLWGLMEGWFLVSEVPLYSHGPAIASDHRHVCRSVFERNNLFTQQRSLKHSVGVLPTTKE